MQIDKGTHSCSSNLCIDHCLKTLEDIEDIYHVLYVSVVGSLMYAIHFPWTDTFEHIYVKIREGILGKCKEGVQICAWHFRLYSFPPRKSYTK